MRRNETMVTYISVYKLPLQLVMLVLGLGLGLGLKATIFGLGLGLEAQVLGLGLAVPSLGLAPCGLVNIIDKLSYEQH